MCSLLVSDLSDGTYFFQPWCPVIPSQTSVLIHPGQPPFHWAWGLEGLKNWGHIIMTQRLQRTNLEWQRPEYGMFSVCQAPETQTAQVKQEIFRVQLGRSFQREENIPIFTPKPGGSRKRGALVSSIFLEIKGDACAFFIPLTRGSQTVDLRPGWALILSSPLCVHAVKSLKTQKV